MNQKQIGTLLIIIGILLVGYFYYTKMQNDRAATAILNETGTCFTEDGTCLHAQSSNFFLIGIIISTIILALGIYLIYFDKSQQQLHETHKQVSSAIEKSKENKEFDAFLAGFDEEEKKVLKAIHDHEGEGILQSTLRYRTGIGKAQLSLIISRFEKKGIISKKKEKKTNRLFLKKVY